MKPLAWIAIAIYVVVYGVSVFHLNGAGSYPIEEAITILVLLGFGFPLLSWVVTIGVRPIELEVRQPAAQSLVALMLTIGLGAYLIYMRTWADGLVPDAAQGGHADAHMAWVLALKLLSMVMLPFLAVQGFFNVRLQDFGFSGEAFRRLLGRDGLTVLVVGSAICAFQYFAGSAAAPFREGKYATDALQIGLPFAFAWLVLEVGLTEEFFFRALLQERLSAFLRSDIAGMIFMALIFGLVHAPGIVLRGAGVVEGLGANPDLITAMAYTVVVQSVAAFMFGILWLRTRNLLVVMLVHAATDLLSNASDIMGAIGIAPIAS
ncbi:MAG: CPBP family intramembrane glutamic endopeptidase [Micropepsaceae bacterium]